jgi:hypothetical protein
MIGVKVLALKNSLEVKSLKAAVKTRVISNKYFIDTDLMLKLLSKPNKFST